MAWHRKGENHYLYQPMCIINGHKRSIVTRGNLDHSSDNAAQKLRGLLLTIQKKPVHVSSDKNKLVTLSTGAFCRCILQLDISVFNYACNASRLSEQSGPARIAFH